MIFALWETMRNMRVVSVWVVSSSSGEKPQESPVITARPWDSFFFPFTDPFSHFQDCGVGYLFVRHYGSTFCSPRFTSLSPQIISFSAHFHTIFSSPKSPEKYFVCHCIIYTRALFHEILNLGLLFSLSSYITSLQFISLYCIWSGIFDF